MMARALQDHHVIPRQRIEIARSMAAVKEKLGGELSDGERRLLETSITTLFADRRNIVRIGRRRHHRAHNGFERMKLWELPAQIDEFAADYGLEWALAHELRLIAPKVRGER
jgi:hypothetical protein